ncbi:single-stranded-DNA-specific exonuclease RecJ [Ureibacillus terrenus]|uniref:Single-stranded-DNA-specific exonuclease RecJ n=1 Tax=Ureibacillus terrenus TaxID=118246 RepID=A0A540V060_9BACL|nr:single-stranded-DNA-specific exonuclease RecJ [Ureibacillus terrenus]MED3662653.1 single-stranded-DNA-specific exonuclease RecJ [Ureibacillus terrenus]MED3764895.1 single-stranded-DNA-specific exonuclease RecJ [Ureibacillus terrenus]TQE90098.1 single-stranded-DNA-specific exonuclease RecJ [Ureibacillus terrenus]
MIQSSKKWKIQKPDESFVGQLRKELNITSLTAKILASRVKTIEEAKNIFYMDDRHLHNPFLLAGMKEAVERIELALDRGEKILIYGDYDADGITSTTIMLNVLLDLGADVEYEIPNRFTHGYGPHEELFRKAHENGIQLIITVDNGISGIEPIRLAKELGMDVIVTDHHEPGDELPPADVIVHPRIPEGHYPFGELAGVGVAFKLAHALYGEEPDHLYEYAAIGTIADLVPLTGENRYIAKKGIEQIRKSNSPWVKALCEASGVKQQEIDEEIIGFYFGPRLNAIGRLGDAKPGVEFLMSGDLEFALQGAKLLNQKNNERKEYVASITEEAIGMIENDPRIGNSLVLVVAKEGWHAGVIGIVASRLVEKYYKPAIVFSIDPETGLAKGSGRSIEGFHLYNELAKNRDILPHFGGHPMAAGMTLSREHIDELRERLHRQASQCLTEELLTPKLYIDVPVDLGEVSVEAIEEVQSLKPFGIGFEKPVFAIQQVSVRSMRKIGANEDHIKMELENEYGILDAVGFNKGFLYNEITYGVKISIAGDLQINEWQGRKKPQFFILDVQTSEWQLFDYRGKANVPNLLNNIPMESSFVAFRKETLQYFGEFLPSIQLIEDEMYGSLSPFLVLLDLPKRVQEMEKLIETARPKRIYAVFYTPNSLFFNGMPTRKHFVHYYTLIKSRPFINLNEHLRHLSKHLGLNAEAIKFMTKVFFELGFVTIENGLIKVNQFAEKRSLTEAASYQLRKQQIELEQQFLYSTYSELKQWFNERIKEFSYS